MSPPHNTAPPSVGKRLLRHAVTGVVAGWVLMLGLVWSDVGHVGSLMDRSPIGWIGYLMLVAAFASTGAAVGVGVALTTEAER